MNQLTRSDPFTRETSRHQPTARIAPGLAHHRWGAALRQWWDRQWMDDRTAYLSHAEDAVDLEYRIRRWNDHDRRGRMPFI